MRVRNECLGQDLFITRHARQRFDERASGGSIEEFARLAVPFGGQYGTGCIKLRHADVVFPTRVLGGVRRVVTTLTIAQSIANMEANVLDRFEEALPKPKRVVAPTATGIAVLAVKHALDGASRKQRNAELIDAGYDLSGKAGDMYRCAREAVLLAFAKCDVPESQVPKLERRD